MGKETLVIVLGAWTVLLPFLGFPTRWDMYLFAVTGALLVGLGISLQRSALRRQRRRAERLAQQQQYTADEARHVNKHGHFA